jgi:NAD(P)H-hydrate epimerase
MTLIGVKLGPFTGQSADYLGELQFDDLQSRLDCAGRPGFTAQRLVRTNLPQLPGGRACTRARLDHVLVVVIMVLPVPVCYLRRVRCARVQVSPGHTQ